MGNIQFAGKALLITLMFVVPLAWISWLFFTTQLDNIAFSAKERVGVEYVRAVIPVIRLAQELRRDAVGLAASGKAPSTLVEVRNNLDRALADLAQVDKQLGATLGTSKALEKAGEQLQKAQGAEGAQAVFDAYTGHIGALAELLTVATDGSNLTLDPDIDSYYLMDAALFRIPDIVESVGVLRGLGLAVMKSGAATPAQTSRLVETIPIAQFQFRNLTEGLNKALNFNGTLRRQLNIDQVFDTTSQFMAFARKSVIDGQDYSPEAQANYLQLANRGIADQYALSERLITSLDQLLQVRIAGMRNNMFSAIAVLALFMALAAYFFASFYFSLSLGLKSLRNHLHDLASGDLRVVPPVPAGRDELADVQCDLRDTFAALDKLLRDVGSSVQELQSSSEQVAQASGDLAASTESAAANLEEQAAAMEEIGSTVSVTADRANQASKFATDNARVAERGGKVFAEVVGTMHDIQASSAKISDIISVIDGIAFQTNILALNAAVEAARAGESGRGFAVVASEVRSLAGRSADAAREIKSLISASVEKVQGGTAIVEQAGKTMNEVVENAQKINQYLSEISTASREQAIGVEEVGRAVQELDRRTQGNALVVTQNKQVADQLREQADGLSDAVGRFQLA